LVKITFDPAKRQTTLESRGLDMALAGEVFSGPGSFRPPRGESFFHARLFEQPDGGHRVDAARWRPPHHLDEESA
jgi:hypothetical protein